MVVRNDDTDIMHSLVFFPTPNTFKSHLDFAFGYPKIMGKLDSERVKILSTI